MSNDIQGEATEMTNNTTFENNVEILALAISCIDLSKPCTLWTTTKMDPLPLK